MVFSSVVFLFYFLPAFLAVYLVARPLRMWVIIAFSVLFYAWGEPVYVGLLLVFIVFNWAVGRAVGVRRPEGGGPLLAFGIAANLLLLAVFKYAGFAVAQVNALIAARGGTPLPVPAIALPLGISFFAFQGISYLVDIGRGTVRAQSSLAKFAMYKAMFPQLIAGPIVRYAQISGEIDDRRLDIARIRHGMELFMLGFASKVLIANTVALPADRVFALPPDGLSPAIAWFGAVCYGVQILFDFAGYTTMAIGLGHMIGFSLPPNFDRPYLSRSITEFWRRWHISLSTWFRDYLYVPMGGNRRGRLRTSVNLLVVFALCGLWHGAAWTFVVWGLYHGAFLIGERVMAGRPGLPRLPVVLRHAYVLLVVLVGWVVFRSDSLAQAGAMLSAMAGHGPSSPVAMPVERLATWSVAAALAAAVLIVAAGGHAPALDRDAGARRAAVVVARFGASLGLFVLSAASLASGTHNPFIYFRF